MDLSSLSFMFLFANFLAIIGGFACFVFYRLIERVVFVFWDVLLDP